MARLKVGKLTWVVRAAIYKLFFWNMRNVLYLGKPTFFYNIKNIIFGKRFRIYPHARVELSNAASCEFGDNTAIGDNFHLICQSKILIGNDFLCSSNVFISDTDHSFQLSSVPFINQPCVTKDVHIGNNVFLGKNVVILAGTKLGDNTIVAANAVVRGNHPDNVVLAGVPAKIIRVL